MKQCKEPLSRSIQINRELKERFKNRAFSLKKVEVLSRSTLSNGSKSMPIVDPLSSKGPSSFFLTCLLLEQEMKLHIESPGDTVVPRVEASWVAFERR